MFKLAFFMVMLVVSLMSACGSPTEDAEKHSEAKLKKERAGTKVSRVTAAVTEQTSITDSPSIWWVNISAELASSGPLVVDFSVAFAINKSNEIPEHCDQADIVVKVDQSQSHRLDVEEGQALSWRACAYDELKETYTDTEGETGQLTVNRSAPNYTRW